MSTNPRIGLMPFIAYIKMGIIFAWWTVSAVYLYSIGTAKYDPESFVAGIEWP